MRYFDLAYFSYFLILVMKTTLEFMLFSNARRILNFCRMELIHECTENCKFFAYLGHLDLRNTLCESNTQELTRRLLDIVTYSRSFCEVISHVGHEVLSTRLSNIIKLKFHSLVVRTAVSTTTFASSHDCIAHLLALLL